MPSPGELVPGSVGDNMSWFGTPRNRWVEGVIRSCLGKDEPAEGVGQDAHVFYTLLFLYF